MRYFDNTMSTFFGKPKVNRKAILFGGTTEGRILYGVLHKKGYATNTYVATQYGASLINEDDQSIHVGRLNEEEMSRLFSEEKPDFIIDATHPFADVVTKNISDAAVANGITYYRVEREANDTSFQNIIVVNSLRKQPSRFQILMEMFFLLQEVCILENFRQYMTSSSGFMSGRCHLKIRLSAAGSQGFQMIT